MYIFFNYLFVLVINPTHPYFRSGIFPLYIKTIKNIYFIIFIYPTTSSKYLFKIIFWLKSNQFNCTSPFIFNSDINIVKKCQAHSCRPICPHQLLLQSLYVWSQCSQPEIIKSHTEPLIQPEHSVNDQ